MKKTTKYKIKGFLRRIKNHTKKNFKVKMGDQFMSANKRGTNIAYIVTDIQKIKSTKHKKTKTLYELNGNCTVEEKDLKKMVRLINV